MKFMGGLFESKAASAAGAIARATGSSNTGNSGVYTPPVGWDIDKVVKDAYERVIWVFRCVDAIATAQADMQMVVRRGDKIRGEVVEYRDINKMLNVRPNEYEDAWQFRYRVSSLLLLSPRGVFIEVIKSNSGGIAELHVLPPGCVEPIPGHVPTPQEKAMGIRQKFVDGYQVRRSDWVVDRLDPEQVIWMRNKPHPADPYLQTTPLQSARLAIETDFFARLFNRNFLQNDGRPGLIVAIQGKLGQTDAQEIKRRFSGGYATAGQTTVVEAEGLAVQDLAGNPRDLQWAEMITGSKNDILLAFGTPESVLGNASGRTFDNADAEKSNWLEDTVVPHCNSVARPLDVLTGDNTDEDMLVHDFSKVDLLQRHANNRKKAKAEEFAAGLCTMDEYLIEAGEKPLDIPVSRVRYLPNGLIVGDPADVEAVKNAPMLPINGGTPSGNEETARRGALAGIQEGSRALNNVLAARALRTATAASAPRASEAKTVSFGIKSDPHTINRMELENYIEGALASWGDTEEQVIVTRLEHTKVRKGTRHWEGEPGDKALNTSYVVEMDKWGADVRKSLETRLGRVARREACMVVKDMQENGLDVSMSPVKVDQVLSPVLDMIETAAKNQSERIARKIEQMDADGATMNQIKSEVRKMMSNRSDWRKQLATNVTTATIEGVRAAFYKEGGSNVQKTWNAHDDEKTRHSHRHADGQTRRADRPFRVGGVKMDAPCDTKAPASETANCRCWVSWSIVTSPRLKENRSTEEKREVG